MGVAVGVGVAVGTGVGVSVAVGVAVGTGVGVDEGRGICVASGGGLSPQAANEAERSRREKSRTALAHLTVTKMVARVLPVCSCILLYIVSCQQRNR